MKKTIFVIGHINPDTDSICSAIAYAHYLRERHSIGRNVEIIPVRAGNLNNETKFVLKYFRVKQPPLLKDGKNKNLILVDHNEISLAIKNIRKANILEIIDHHRIGDVETIHPIPFENEPRGATSSIIGERYYCFHVPFTKQMAGLILSGILSDTVLLNSPTTTYKDKILARRLAKIANVDIESYGRKMLEVGCDLINHSANKIIVTDFKTFGDYSHRAGIGQIMVVDTNTALKRKDELLKEMERIAKKKHFAYIFLMITNILTLQTNLLVVGDIKKVKKVFKRPIKENMVILPNTVSRKKQIQPKVLNLLKLK